MILFASAAAALIGWVLADFEGYGLIIGGIIGALMGLWLRAAVRAEVRDQLAKAQAEWRQEQAQFASQPQTDRARSSEPDSRVTAPVREQARPSALEPQSGARSRPATSAAAAPVGRSANVSQPLEPAQPSMVEQWIMRAINGAKDWLFGGNTIVRVGLVLLFVGLSFLASYAASAGWFPIEVRLALVALSGAGLLGFGFFKRVQRPDFGLALQGAGVAVLYLTIFAAARIYGLMPPLLSFGLMVVFAALGCTLALLQNARVMAFIALFGGYAVPILLGGEAETPLGLFTYMTILNAALLVIAWRRSWRELNLLGFFATFGLATLWAASGYTVDDYLVCQIFLLLNIAIFVAAAVLYAHNTPGRLGQIADATLLFGPALVGFGLQVGLVQDRPYGSAFAALGFGALYLVIAAITMRQGRATMRLVNECLLAIGVGFATLAIPLAFDAQWTSAAWAVEGLAAFWVGARQARWMPRAFGLALQVVAGMLFLATTRLNVSPWPFANTAFLGAMMIAVPLLLTAWWTRSSLPHSGSTWARGYAGFEWGGRHLLFFGGYAFVALALLLEVTRRLPAASVGAEPVALFAAQQQILLAMLAQLGLMTLSDWFGRRRAWAAATWPAMGSLPLVIVAFLAARGLDMHMLNWPDLIAWALAIAAHLWLLWRSDTALAGQTAHPRAKWNFGIHAAGIWLGAAILADSLDLAIDRLALWTSSWAGVTFLLSAVAVLLTLVSWAGRSAPLATSKGLSWPLNPAARAYWLVASIPIAFLAYGGALTAAAFAQGVTDPLPYLPILNPVDISVALSIGVLLLWRRMMLSGHGLPSPSPLDKGGLIALGLLGFVAISGVWLRTAHHWLAVAWTADGLWNDAVVQLGLAILWSALALGLMLFAHRRALRYSWLAGAGLLGVVVVKLLLVDMSNAQGWERIVTFIGVGLLMLVVGYFVPLPPRSAEDGDENKGEQT
jgi:uncharacterized membrane protein